MPDDEIKKPIEEPVEAMTTEVVVDVGATPTPITVEVKKEEQPESSPADVPILEEVVVDAPIVEEKVENVITPEEVKEIIPPTSTSTPNPTIPSVNSNPLSPEPVLKPEPELKIETKIEMKPEPKVEVKPEINSIPVILPTVSPLDRIALSFKANMLKARENLVLARKATKAKMMKSVYKVMDLFKKKKSIKNMDVQKFVHVSHSTAVDYLNILTKEGKIKKEGKPTAPKYTKNDK